MKKRIIFGFHAVIAHIRYNAISIKKIYVNVKRYDDRMRNILHAANSANIRVIQTDNERLSNIVGINYHQGIVAIVSHQSSLTKNLDDLLDTIKSPPLLLILDGITDPHNLGACLRVADNAGVHAVIAPKDRAVGLNATVIKVASGAVETVPYIMVTNLVRTMHTLKARGIVLVGMSEDANQSLYMNDFTCPVALLIGSENKGMRQLTRKTCDILLKIPIFGSVNSLNVSVASGVCLYEARRQRFL